MDWTRVYQIGVVVEDLDAAIAYYEAIGIGPFTEGPSESARSRRVYGQPSDAIVRGACAPMGPVELELLQPVEGDSVQAEALRERGEHVLHVCSYTDDIEEDIRVMAERGFPVISEGDLADGGRFAYFDTRRTGGMVLEMHQLPT